MNSSKNLLCALFSILEEELLRWKEEAVSQQQQLFDRQMEILFGSKQPK